MSKVALLQLTTGCNIEKNLSQITKHVEEAVEQGASLIVLPEN